MYWMDLPEHWIKWDWSVWYENHSDRDINEAWLHLLFNRGLISGKVYNRLFQEC